LPFNKFPGGHPAIRKLHILDAESILTCHRC
jgi:hypothetical protein